MNDSKQAGTAEYIPERVFVVGGDESGSRTTCKGDSGSPVVRSNDHGHWEVIGIVRGDIEMTDIIGHLSPSPLHKTFTLQPFLWHIDVILASPLSWSRGCGRRFRPSVWTRVESFVPWVKRKMREDGIGRQSISPEFFFR